MDCDLVNVNECDLNSWTFNFGDKVVMTRCNYLIYSRCTTCQINYDKGNYGDTCPDCHRRLRTISHGSRKTRGKVKRI